MFHIDPARVGEVSLKWWMRWQLFSQAKAARASHLKAQTMDAGDLPPDDVSNIVWAREE